MVVCSTWKVTMFLTVAVFFIFSKNSIRFPKNEPIVWKRYSEEVLKAICKFEKVDYKLRKAKLDVSFLVKCQNENIIPNFLKFCLANKNLQNSANYRNVNKIFYKQKSITRNHIRELCNMNSITCIVIYNLDLTVLILLIFPLLFLVVMIIF